MTVIGPTGIHVDLNRMLVELQIHVRDCNYPTFSNSYVESNGVELD